MNSHLYRWGLEEILGELPDDDLVAGVPSQNNFCEIRITAKGRSLLLEHSPTNDGKQ
jgi:hypothetical protein